MKPLSIISLFVALSTLLFACAFAPVNNQYEKAGTLKKGNVELSGSFTGYRAIETAGSINTNNNLGFRAGLGISDKFDLKFRYERLMPGRRLWKSFWGRGFQGSKLFQYCSEIRDHSWKVIFFSSRQLLHFRRRRWWWRRGRLNGHDAANTLHVYQYQKHRWLLNGPQGWLFFWRWCSCVPRSDTRCGL